MSIRILNGDCREVIKTLADKSVHSVVTSPPYWGLRDYGVDGQIGLEASPDEFVAEMVAVFREVRRVMQDDGTLWLNLGDSYSRNAAKGGSGPNGKHDYMPDYSNAKRILSETKGSSDGAVGRGDRAAIRNGAEGLKEKDLVGIPWLVAFALRGDGWYLRSDIIWHKPNPMPESVTDRPTSSHEHVFLLTKSQRYFYDAEAIREENVSDRPYLQHDPVVSNDRKALPGPTSNRHRSSIKGGQSLEAEPVGTRNARNVWTIATTPFAEAHFATFPPELAERCIKAGSKAGDTILDPFAGAFTTAMVADRLQRNAIGIELNPDYCEIARRRLVKDAGLFADLAEEAPNA